MPDGVVDKLHPFWSFRLPKKLCRKRYKKEWSFAKGYPIYSIDCRFNDIDESCKRYYMPFFESLKPSRKVYERIREFGEGIEQLVGVQVRNTNLPTDQKDVSSIETIMAVMNEFDASTEFFVSAMNSEIQDLFSKRYGSRVRFLPHKDCSSMMDAVADMWLLGHCREMIASPGSTFSEVAWWWGGAEIHVRQLKAEYNQKDGQGI